MKNNYESHKDWIKANIIRPACSIWAHGAPENNDGFMKILVDLMQYHKQEILQAAFGQLAGGWEKNYFPKPADWKKAIDSAKEDCFYKQSDHSALSQHVIEGRTVYEFERKAVKILLEFAENDGGKMAKKEGWWGFIYANNVVADGWELAPYLYRGLVFQQKVLGMLPSEFPISRPAAFFTKQETVDQIKAEGLRVRYDRDDLLLMRARAREIWGSV